MTHDAGEPLSATLGGEGRETKVTRRCNDPNTEPLRYFGGVPGTARGGKRGQNCNSKIKIWPTSCAKHSSSAGAAVSRAQTCSPLAVRRVDTGKQQQRASQGTLPGMLGVPLRISPHLADALVSAWAGVALTLVSSSRHVRTSGSSSSSLAASFSSRLARCTFSWRWRLGLRRTPPSTPSCRSLAEERSNIHGTKQ